MYSKMIKRAITIAKLVETKWLSRYPKQIEITYDQVREFIGHEFREYLIEDEYGINAKPITLGNTMSNAILERINQVLGKIVQTFNIQQTYVDKNYPWTVILDATEFEIHSTTSRKKNYISGQLIFGRDMILPIKHRVDWELICQRKQTQINRDNAHENRHRVEHDYNAEDKVILPYHTV